MRDFLSFELPGGTYMQRLEALVAENKCRLVSAAGAAARARCGDRVCARKLLFGVAGQCAGPPVRPRCPLCSTRLTDARARVLRR